MSWFGYVDDELAHELTRVATSDDGSEHRAVHLCAKGFFELRTAGCELAGRREGLDTGIVPEDHQVVEIGLGVWTEQKTGGGEHGGLGAM